MDKKISAFGFGLFLVLLFVFLFAFFSTYSACSGKKISVEGKVVLVGNEPFTRLILENKDGTYILESNNSLQEKLLAAQNKKIRVQGKFVKDSQEMIGSKGTIQVKSFTTLQN